MDDKERKEIVKLAIKDLQDADKSWSLRKVYEAKSHLDRIFASDWLDRMLGTDRKKPQ